MDLTESTICWLPLAICWIAAEISCTSFETSLTSVAMAAKSFPAVFTTSLPLRTSFVPSCMADTAVSVSAWIPPIKSAICFAASCDCSANLRTSSETTAKPFPCSPARAASIAAFKASKFVCPAIPEMVSTIWPISFDLSPNFSTTIADLLTVCSMVFICFTAVSIAWFPSCAATAVLSEVPATLLVFAATCWMPADICSTTAEVSSIALSCLPDPAATSEIAVATWVVTWADCCALAVNSSDAADSCSADSSIWRISILIDSVTLLDAKAILPNSSFLTKNSWDTSFEKSLSAKYVKWATISPKGTVIALIISRLNASIIVNAVNNIPKNIVFAFVKSSSFSVFILSAVFALYSASSVIYFWNVSASFCARSVYNW